MNSFRGTDRVFIRGGVLDLLRIEQDQVRGIALTQQAAVGKAEAGGGETRHLVDRVFQTEEPDIAHIVTEDAREGAPEPWMRMLIVRQTVRTDHG